MRFLFCLCASVVLTFFSISGAAIRPDQVLIIANRRNRESGAIAAYYANMRNIPDQNILLTDLPDREYITRDIYNRKLAFPIRSFIRQQKLENRIKVLVTVYGVPLKVGPSKPTFAQRKTADLVRQKYFYAFTALERHCRELEQLAGVTTRQPTTLPARNRMRLFLKNLPGISRKIHRLYGKTARRLKSIGDPVEKRMIIDQFIRLRLILEGQVILLETMPRENPDYQKLSIRLKEMESRFWNLTRDDPAIKTMDERYSVAQNLGGLLLKLKTLFEDRSRLLQKDSLSSVDSELSLLLWDHYELAGRIPNGLNPRFRNHPYITGEPPILMVSRLDGPGAGVVRRIIREAIEAEKHLPAGKFYIDARGLKKKTGYIVYDNDLRGLYKLIRTKTSLPVKLDNKPTLFPPGSCPRTLLYCGWYSLRRYIPAFTFLPGSVGYHIASFEAETLRNKKSNVWCKRMLEEGITATLGPVDEPFLDAFPLPSEFFSLLLTGKYSLVEVFYMTKRYNSWRMTLIGDPLYNPFASKPQLDPGEVQLKPLSLLLIR